MANAINKKMKFILRPEPKSCLFLVRTQKTNTQNKQYRLIIRVLRCLLIKILLNTPSSHPRNENERNRRETRHHRRLKRIVYVAQ